MLALLGGCGYETASGTYKTPGVGLNPEEIGPAPVSQGGLIEYHYIDFAGAGLPLGLTGLVSYDAIGPQALSMLPPYGMIYGQGFVLSSDIPQMDVAFGTFGSPLQTPNSCYTNYEPRAYLNTMADIGQAITFKGDDFEFNLGRRPDMYPKNNQEKLFPYYSAIAAHRASPLMGLVDVGEGSFAGAERRVIRNANWKHGARVDISFPGGIPPQDSSVSSIPMPLAAAGGDTSHYLPGEPDGVMISWTGPVYDADGNVVGEGESRRCLTFADMSYQPDSPEDCLRHNLPDASVGTASQDILDSSGAVVLKELKGQMYTAPWDTADGSITFSWPEGSVGVDETIVVGVRLLGPVDLDSEYKQIARIPVEASPNLEARLRMLAEYGYGDPDGEFSTETLYRDKLACESEANGDFEWTVDPTLYKVPGDPNSGYVVSLQGEPTHTVAELICNVDKANSNSFELTQEMMSFALSYGELHGASGAVFYFARTTTKNLDTPSVRDRYGNRKDISSVRVQTSSAKLGRFWWNR